MKTSVTKSTSSVKEKNSSLTGGLKNPSAVHNHITNANWGGLLRRVKKDDMIICAELSRLGRNLFMIMEILEPDFPTHQGGPGQKEGVRAL